MKDFQYYKDCFLNLHTAQAKKLPAPHKPLLLLSIIDMVDSGHITSNKIELSDQLVGMFKTNANRYIGHSMVFKPSIGKPFYHLQHEPFWSLIPVAQEKEQNLAADAPSLYGPKKAVYSLKGLRRQYKYALIDKALFELLQNADVRAKFRTILISRYLTRQPNSVTPLSMIPLVGVLSFIA